MSDINLTQIIAPELGSSSYGANISTQFTNIDNNFTKIVQGEYLKGQSGDLVMLEEIDLVKEIDLPASTLQIKNSFLEYIGGFNLSPNGIGDINSQKLYMIYTINTETNQKIYKSSLPYTFLDPRFNPIDDANDDVKDFENVDKSCIIIYDTTEFKSYNAFPNIYFNSDQNEFCWKINGCPTSLPARGPMGRTGHVGAMYVLSAVEELSAGTKYYKVKFLITPEEFDGYDKAYLSGEIVKEIEGQVAFVYRVDANKNTHIYVSEIKKDSETINGENQLFAKCYLDESTELNYIFATQTLKDVLTEVKSDKDFNYLFIPSKFNANTGQLEQAHVVTTKISGDQIPEPRQGFSWDYLQQITWEQNSDPTVCIISPAIIGEKRQLLNDSYTLYNNYKTTICPGSSYFGEIATGELFFDNDGATPDDKWSVKSTQDGKTLHIGRNSGDDNTIIMKNSSLNVSKDITGEGNLSITNDITGGGDLSIGGDTTIGNEVTGEGSLSVASDITGGGNIRIANNITGVGDLNIGGSATIENKITTNEIILKDALFSDSKNANGMPALAIDALEGGLRLNTLNVIGDARFGKIDSLNYDVPSIILTDHYNDNDLNSIRSHLVYLTWKYNTSNLYIPSIIEGVNDYSNKCYLSAGKSRYIINAIDKLTGPSIGTINSTKIHLSFDMSKDWPPTEIEWNFERTPESISFSGKDVRIYTDFQFTVNGISTNCITVNGGASGINFKDYIGDLRKVNSILLTPFNAASTGSYKAYKLTFENTDIYEYANELDVIQNKLLVQMAEFEVKADNKYLAKDTKLSWSDISDTPEIPEFSFKNDTVVIKKGDSSFTLPTNIQTAIQSEVNLSLKSQDFITKDTLTMMGGLNSSNPGLSYDDTEPVVQLLNKQSEGYVITDFCNIIVKYLDGNAEVELEKYLQWPIKGNVIRGVYHPAESNGTLSMSVAVVAKSEISINGIDVNVAKITIDGRDPMFGLGCSYGDTKTVPWEVKLEGDKNFKTTVSGYVTLTYTA